MSVVRERPVSPSIPYAFASLYFPFRQSCRITITITTTITRTVRTPLRESIIFLLPPFLALLDLDPVILPRQLKLDDKHLREQSDLTFLETSLCLSELLVRCRHQRERAQSEIMETGEELCHFSGFSRDASDKQIYTHKEWLRSSCRVSASAGWPRSGGHTKQAENEEEEWIRTRNRSGCQAW